MPSQPDLGGLPVFRTPDHEEETPEIPQSQDETPSPPPSPPPTEPPAPSPASSTRTSTEGLADVEGALGSLAAGLAQVLGVAANKVAVRRAHRPTDLWAMTEEEAEAIGAPVGRMATRKAPTEVVNGDGPDIVALLGALLGYVAHNAVGLSAADMARAHDARQPAAPETREPSPPAPEPTYVRAEPAAPAPAPAVPPASGTVDGVAPPSPPPRGVPMVL